MNIDELLTYEDIAELTGISLNTLYQWKARGKLPEPDLLFRGPLWYPNTIKIWNETRRSSLGQSDAG